MYYMCNVKRMKKDFTINEAVLLAFIDGKLSADEAAAVERWYDASEENRKTLEQLWFVVFLGDRADMLRRLDPEKSLAELKRRIAAKERSDRRRSRFAVAARSAMRYAAVVMLSFAAAGAVVYYSRSHTEYCEIVADSAAEKTVVLPDGSVAVLKADSRISFPSDFADNHREVKLDGEVLFDVVKMNGADFCVNMDGARIVVRGTKFNVRAYSGCRNVETVLIEGAIDFHSAGHDIAVKPNQKVVYDSGSRRINIVDVDARMEVYGSRTFESEPLRNVFRLLEHVYGCTISFADDRIADIRFSGTVCRDNPLDHSLDIITLTTGTEFSRDGDRIVIRQ